MDKVAFVNSELSFRVKDVNASVKFYTGVLNFQKEYFSETPWEHAIIKRDDVIIHLNKVNVSEEITGWGCAFIKVRGIEELWQNLKNDECMLSDLQLSDYYPETGVREFILRDFDGNILRFCEVVE